MEFEITSKINRRQFLVKVSITAALPLFAYHTEANARSMVSIEEIENQRLAIQSNSVKFNGMMTDNLLYMQHLGNGYRTYNQLLMRFHSQDSMSPFGDGGVNSYSYVYGDPLNYTDSTGHIRKRSTSVGHSSSVTRPVRRSSSLLDLLQTYEIPPLNRDFNYHTEKFFSEKVAKNDGGYKSNFYTMSNIVGYTGNLYKNPTVYFHSKYKFGRIVQSHDNPNNVGRGIPQYHESSSGLSYKARNYLDSDGSYFFLEVSSPAGIDVFSDVDMINQCQIHSSRSSFKRRNSKNIGMLATSIDRFKYLKPGNHY